MKYAVVVEKAGKIFLAYCAKSAGLHLPGISASEMEQLICERFLFTMKFCEGRVSRFLSSLAPLVVLNILNNLSPAMPNIQIQKMGARNSAVPKLAPLSLILWVVRA